MFDYIVGAVADKLPDGVVLDRQGMGYYVLAPESVLRELPAKGEEVKLYTYLHVREDILALYGFLSKADRKVFLQLINVSGIGPKAGLAILSVLSVRELQMAVLAQDAKAIAKAPGVGAKTAQRVIIELKDKIDVEEMTSQNQVQEVGMDVSDAQTEAYMGLVNLGYDGSDVSRALSMVEDRQNLDTVELIKETLSKLRS